MTAELFHPTNAKGLVRRGSPACCPEAHLKWAFKLLADVTQVFEAGTRFKNSMLFSLSFHVVQRSLGLVPAPDAQFSHRYQLWHAPKRSYPNNPGQEWQDYGTFVNMAVGSLQDAAAGLGKEA